MRFMINAVALVALALPAGLSAQQSADAPACRANLDGNQLTTAIEFPDGYAVEAPWNLSWNRAATLENGQQGVAAAAQLDRIVELDPASGQRIVTPFPEPIETKFEGATEDELVYRAAQIWCLTVLKAQEQETTNSPQPSTRQSRSGVVGP